MLLMAWRDVACLNFCRKLDEIRTRVNRLRFAGAKLARSDIHTLDLQQGLRKNHLFLFVNREPGGYLECHKHASMTLIALQPENTYVKAMVFVLLLTTSRQNQ